MALLRAFSLCLGIAFFTWLGFRCYPGHAWLQSDTQIYVPMLERIDDPGFLARDILAVRPTLAFTVYDEVTLAVHKTGPSYQLALEGQQILFRAAALLGVVLLATSIGIPLFPALLIATFLGLGAFLAGPDIQIMSCEPSPRSFALSLVVLALGFLAHRRPLPAGLAAGLALLYHPPLAAPFWCVVFLAFSFDKNARRHWKPMLITFAIACLLLANLAQLQPNIIDAQNFFGVLSSSLMKLQLFRTPYVYVSTWAPSDVWHYLFLLVCALWAASRFSRMLHPEVRWFFILLPISGMVALPLSWAMLERLHLALAPQWQPATMLVYTVAMALISCGMAGVLATRLRRPYEAIAWFVIVAAIVVNTRVLDLLIAGPSALALAVVVALAIASAVLTLFSTRRWLSALPLIVPLAAIAFLPQSGIVAACRNESDPALVSLSRWAKDNTWGSSMFLFPDDGQSREPGAFRALSERAIYVDWISGRQVTHFESFANEWYPRYLQVLDGKFTVHRLEDMLSLPIDYYVLKRPHTLIAIKPAYANNKFVVYDAQDLRNASTSLRLGTDD